MDPVENSTRRLEPEELAETNLEDQTQTVESGLLTKPDVTVIVPVLNEAGAITDVLNELKENGLRNIVVVDGHSTDGTAKLAAEWGAKVITQEGSGKVRAVRSGVNHVATDLILVVDGDRTYDVSAIDEMMQLIQDSDEVICARTKGRENIPRVNRLGNKVIGWVFNALFSTHLTDVLSGMYLVRTKALKAMWVESEGFSLEVEVASSIASTSRRLREVQGDYRPRVGKAKLQRRHGLSIFWDAVKLTWRYNPAVFVFGVFSALLIPALFIYAWVGYRYLIMGQKHFVWAIIGTVVGGVSVISFSLAVISLYIKRFEYRVMERLDWLERK
jgi:dolichol-phosphate hexosyltransferase